MLQKSIAICIVKIYKLRQEYLFVSLSNTFSFFIRLKQLGDVWLFNCFEGCQHILKRKKVKISQVKKIIITSNSVECISGLLGLLSSINLNTKTNRLDIYAPRALHKYILWGRKYSQTNFRYELYVHTILDGLIAHHVNLSIYTVYQCYTLGLVNCIILFSEQPGPFNSTKAVDYKIPFGRLYGYFKLRKNFILPDGFIAYSNNFLHGYYLGNKVLFIFRDIREGIMPVLSNYTYLTYY